MKGIGEMGGESSGASTVAADSVNVPDMRVSAGPGYVMFTDASMQGERTKATEEALSDSVFLGKSRFKKPFEAHRKMLEEAIDQKSFLRRTNAGDDKAPGVSVSMMTWREGVAHTTFLGDAPVWIAEIDPEHNVTMHRLNPVTHILDPFQPEKRTELHNGGREKQALVARLLNPKNSPVNLNKYGDISCDKLERLPDKHIATQKSFEEAVKQGNRFTVFAGTRGLVSSSDSLREEAEDIVDRMLHGEASFQEDDRFENVFSVCSKYGKQESDDVQEVYRQLEVKSRGIDSSPVPLMERAEGIVGRILDGAALFNETNSFIDVFTSRDVKKELDLQLNDLILRYQNDENKEDFRNKFVKKVFGKIVDENCVKYAQIRDKFYDDLVQSVGHALRRYDAEQAALAYGEALSAHLSQGGKLDDPSLAIALNEVSYEMMEREGWDIEKRPDFGFIVAELNPDKELTVVAAEAGGPEAAPLVSRLKQIASKRLELYESEGLKIPDSAAPLFQVETGLERIDERSEGGSSRRDDVSVSPVSERAASSGSESGFSFSRAIPTEASMNAAELDGFDFVQVAASDQGSLRSSSSGSSGRGLADDAVVLSFTDSFQYNWENGSNASGSEKSFSFGDEERDGAEMGSLFSPEPLNEHLLNNRNSLRFQFEPAESSSLFAVPQSLLSESVMLPSNYGGDARVAAGENYVAFTDSGGESKYHGINHDRVAAGETSYENPLKVHFDIIDQAETLAAGVNQGESKKNASGSTLSIVTWKDNEALTTYLGDSPVWVMEVKADGGVKPHLLNPEMHNYDPLNSNEVMYRVDGSAKDNILGMLQTAPVQMLTEGGPAEPSNAIPNDVFSTRKNFSKQLEAGSRLYVLAGSDGLLDHVGANGDELTAKIRKLFKSSTDAEAGGPQELSAESLALRQRVVNYYINEKLSEKDLTYKQKQEEALNALQAAASDDKTKLEELEDEAFEVAFEARQMIPHTNNVIASFVKVLAAEETRAQLKQAAESYAHLFEDHLKAGGAANDPALAVKMNDAATRMHAASGKVSENPSYETNPVAKDNTGFVILGLEEGKQVTALVADGNREFGDVVSSTIRDVARSSFAVPYDMSGLEKPHSAEPAYVELNEGCHYTEVRPDYRQQDALVALRSGNLKQYLREREVNPDLPAREFFEARQVGQGGGGPVQKRDDEITEEPRSSARRDEAPGSKQRLDRQAERSSGDAKQSFFRQLLQRAVTLPLKNIIQFGGGKRDKIKDRDVAPASSLAFAPEHYGGDARVASGTERGIDYAAFSDSGGRLDKFNQDRVSVGLSSFESPYHTHRDIIVAANKSVRDVDGSDGRSGASTLSMMTWKDDKAFVTYLGDSPVWVMELTKEQDVIPHLMNPEFHHADPSRTNDIFFRIDGNAQKPENEAKFLSDHVVDQERMERRFRQRPFNHNDSAFKLAGKADDAFKLEGEVKEGFDSSYESDGEIYYVADRNKTAQKWIQSKLFNVSDDLLNAAKEAESNYDQDDFSDHLRNFKESLTRELAKKIPVHSQRDFGANLREGSQIFALIGSDGLLDHIDPKEVKTIRKVENALNGFDVTDPAASPSLDAKEAERIRERALDLFMEKTTALRADGAPASREDAKVEYKKMLVDYEGVIKDSKEICGSISNKIIKEEMWRNIYAQYEEASGKYAEVFKDHLLSGGKISDPLLPAKINDAATKMYVSSRAEKEVKRDPASVRYHAARSKDNTSFLIVDLDKGKEVTAAVADGNGSLGDIVAMMIVKEVEKRIEPFDLSKLNVRDSASDLYTGVNRGAEVSKSKEIENKLEFDKNRSAAVKRDRMVKSFFENLDAKNPIKIDEFPEYYKRNELKIAAGEVLGKAMKPLLHVSHALRGVKAHLTRSRAEELNVTLTDRQLSDKSQTRGVSEVSYSRAKESGPNLAELFEAADRADGKETSGSEVRSARNSPKRTPPSPVRTR